MVKEASSPESFEPAPSVPRTPCVPGTLMWLGNRTLDEFYETYRFCENRVAQLALRHDLPDAVRRPAASVRRILITRTTRHSLDESLSRELVRAYPAASVLELLGPMCGGELAGSARHDKLQRVHWHQANQFIPSWLRACGDQEPEPRPAAASVAVVAASAQNAEPLMDLAASAGVVAVWCRQPDSFRLRNVDSVWWDDSATGEMSCDAWHQRMQALHSEPPAGPRRHAWLVTSPNIEHCRTAYEAGVERILTKPARIEPLLEMLGVTTAATADSATRDGEPHGAESRRMHAA